jgi:orotidine-5'-phosphate decarboxylase
VALDSTDPDECRALADQTSVAGTHKIGLTAFSSGGPQLVRELVDVGPVFLDLKLHDIPAQVAKAVGTAADLGVAYTTVHASGGRAMLEAAAAAAESRVLLLAVTVLTSLDDGDLSSIGVKGDARAQVLRLAELALGAGAGGLVCSPLEVSKLRETFGASADGGPFLAVPGIRPEGSAPDDQRRTLAPGAVIESGADLLVVGRPITEARDPGAAARAVLEEIAR